MMNNLQTQVLIVGGGPVGLGLAADLGLRGIKCLLVEQGDGTIAHPRANAENARTMELFRRLGIADAPPEVLAVWEKYVDSRPDGSRGFWANTPTQVDQKVRGLAHLMITSAEYHLC